MNGAKVYFTSDGKNLGLRMSSDLTWTTHYNQVVSKVYAGLRSLSANRNLIPMRSRVCLVRPLLISHFIYCEVIFYDGLKSSDRKSLERAFNAYVRFAFGLMKRDSVRDHVDRIVGCVLMRYLDYHTLTFIHDLILRKSPGHLH